MSFSVNPLSFRTTRIDNEQQKASFLDQLGRLLSDIISYLLNPSLLASVLNGNSVLLGSSIAANTVLASNLAASLNDLGSPAGNSVIDTAQSAIVAVRVNWTTAANWTLTLNNLAQGALVYLRLINTSGAARTFTVLANTPASVAYGVSIFTPAASTLSAGVTVNSAQAINGFGTAYTVGGVPSVHLIGSIG